MKYQVGDLVMAIADDAVEPSHWNKLGVVVSVKEYVPRPPAEQEIVYIVMFHGCHCKELYGERKSDCGEWNEWSLVSGKMILSMSHNSCNNRWRNLIALQSR